MKLSNGHCGAAVATGYVNSDKFVDVLVGCDSFKNTMSDSNKGVVYVLYGQYLLRRADTLLSDLSSGNLDGFSIIGPSSDSRYGIF